MCVRTCVGFCVNARVSVFMNVGNCVLSRTRVFTRCDNNLITIMKLIQRGWVGDWALKLSTYIKTQASQIQSMVGVTGRDGGGHFF